MRERGGREQTDRQAEMEGGREREMERVRMKSRKKRRQLTPGWRGAECGWGGAMEGEMKETETNNSSTSRGCHPRHMMGDKMATALTNTGSPSGSGYPTPGGSTAVPGAIDPTRGTTCPPCAGHIVRVTSSEVNGVEKVKKGGILLIDGNR
ncbi:hypothetical protein EYF80_029384 [Liparis tanakae]|uniref:Uncharacterized protein n=1 Tax=Liparis tanakae TaxID=230148 RepID=A0A4Z2H535_9TELE|nr:hypothetical protein EYF80_029384 [Liparis tanakae]